MVGMEKHGGTGPVLTTIQRLFVQIKPASSELVVPNEVVKCVGLVVAAFGWCAADFFGPKRSEDTSLTLW